MKKLLFLFLVLATFAILNCSNNDDMPCLLCSEDSQNGSYVYCLYNDSYDYMCEYMRDYECYNYYDGVGFSNSSDCYNRLYEYPQPPPSSSSVATNVYCFYNSGNSYRCEYMSDYNCSYNYSGVGYSNYNECDYRIPSSSSVRSSSSATVTSYGHYCRLDNASYQYCYDISSTIQAYQQAIQTYQQYAQQNPQYADAYYQAIQQYQQYVSNPQLICGNSYTYTQSCP